MRLNIVLLLIALAIAALAAYGFHEASSGRDYAPVLTVGAGLILFVTLAGTIAVGVKGGQGSALNVRIVSGIFFLAALIEQIIFTLVPLSLPPYIIVTGILLLLYLLIAYGIGKTLQNA